MSDLVKIARLEADGDARGSRLATVIRNYLTPEDDDASV